MVSYLEETVVGADGDVVCLGDVVHQSPEVLDCVKSGHLKIIEMIMMILAQRPRAYDTNTKLEAQFRYFIIIRLGFLLSIFVII